MVKNPRTALCADTIKPVNIPEPVRVEENPPCFPAAVKLTQRQAVTAIEDRWRIDDEWWRSDQISRLYYTVQLASGHRLVLFKDLINKRWYLQA